MTGTQVKEKISLHRSRFGVYHPNPNSDVAWTVNDTIGYLDSGPSCDECGACECECEHGWRFNECPECPDSCTWEDCIGLSFAYVCLDGGEAYCQDCVDEFFDLEVLDCDCS